MAPGQHAEYQALVGSLLFLSVSCRPDITEAVNEVSRFLAAPTAEHWKAAIRILRYMTETPDIGLFYKADGNINDEINVSIICYSDSSWADSSDRKSTSGMMVQYKSQYDEADLIEGSMVTYYSKRQPCVALSSTEAEYVAISRAAQTVCWLRRLLDQLGFRQEQPTLLFEDNTSCISIAESEGLNQRTKHIDVRHHYIRDMVQENIIQIEHLGTDDMLADFFTKALPVARFLELRSRIGLRREKQ